MVETASGRLELAVSGAESGARITVAATDATPPATPVPLAREVVVAAQPETGPALAMRIISVEAPQPQGTVVEASESRAVIETASGRVELAVSGAEPGTRITVATTDAPPPAAPAPLAPEAIVMAQPETGPALAVRIVALEAPALRLRATVVAASENRAEVETPLGRLVLEATAEPGSRLDLEVLGPAAAAPRQPSGTIETGHQVAAEIVGSGQPLRLRVTAVEPPVPRLQGTVVEVAANSAVLETASGRLNLQLSTPPALGTLITVEIAETAPPAAPPQAALPLAIDQVVAARAETEITAAPAAVAAGSVLALRIAEIEAPAERLQGRVVDAGPQRVLVESDVGRLSLNLPPDQTPHELALGARIEAEIVPPETAPPAAENVVVARAESVLTTASTIVAPDQEFALRLISVSQPVIQPERLSGTVVATSERHVQVETAAGRLVLLAEAALGQRLEFDVISRDATVKQAVQRALPPASPRALQPGRQVAAEELASGQPLVLRVVSAEATARPIEGRVVAAAENRLIVDTGSRRLALDTVSPLPRGSMVELEVIEAPSPATPQPLLAGNVVAATLEATPALPETEPAAPLAGLEIGTPLTLRVSAVALPDSQPIPEPGARLRAQVVAQQGNRAIVTTAGDTFSLPVAAAVGSRVMLELTPGAGPGGRRAGGAPGRARQ